MPDNLMAGLKPSQAVQTYSLELSAYSPIVVICMQASAFTIPKKKQELL